MFGAGMATVHCQLISDGTGALRDGYKYMILYEEHYDKSGVIITKSM